LSITGEKSCADPEAGIILGADDLNAVRRFFVYDEAWPALLRRKDFEADADVPVLKSVRIESQGTNIIAVRARGGSFELRLGEPTLKPGSETSVLRVDSSRMIVVQDVVGALQILKR
jgi:hypothetical protein